MKLTYALPLALLLAGVAHADEECLVDAKVLDSAPSASVKVLPPTST